jgi:hypothetical protein
MIKLLDLLKEASPFVPRGSKEERGKEYTRIIQNKIQQYIKDGMEGDLDLSGTSITSLPSNLTKVGGDLILNRSKITKLPDNLTVEGDLYLSFTNIISLPSNLTVGGFLDLNPTPITSLPDNLSVGVLNISNSNITSLPSNLNVKDYIDAYNTPLSKKYSENEIRAMVPNIEGEIYI